MFHILEDTGVETYVDEVEYGRFFVVEKGKAGSVSMVKGESEVLDNEWSLTRRIALS